MKKILSLTALSLGLLGCDDGGAAKSWSALSTCLAGSAAQGPLAARVERLRLMQIENSPPKDDKAWPATCAPHANQLFSAISKTGETAMLRRTLQTKFNCGGEKGTCTFPTDATLPAMTTELWEAAKNAGLKPEPSPGTQSPQASSPPLIDGKSWKSFSTKALKVLGPVLTDDGRGVLLLTPGEGRVRPTGCEFAPGFAKVRCIDATDKVPELPSNGLSVLADRRGLFAAGLTETGLVGYNLETGETSDVRGMGRRIVADGVTVEPAAKKEDLMEDPMAARAAPPKRGAKPAPKDEGFLALEIKSGKASKGVRLPVAPVGDPLSLGNQVVFLTATEAGLELVAKSVAGGRLSDVAAPKGPLPGALHSCRKDKIVGLASYGPVQGQPKPSSSDGKASFAFSLFREGAWSKMAESKIPAQRALDSGLVCTNDGATFTWVSSAEGGVNVGRLDCGADGCKSSEVKLPSLEIKWWWSVGAFGDKVFLLYRGGLGETRLRIAPLAALPTAKDTLIFDSPDYGGPNAGQVTTLLSDEAALLVFRDEKPVALRIGADGSAKLIAP